MITSTTGDLLASRAEALVNTVNTVGVMGKGIALQFKRAYPQNYLLYRAACQRGEVAVGRMFITTERTLLEEKIIVNFPTKTVWWKPSEYSYISAGLRALRDEITRRGIRSIAIPPLGAGNGGLDWQRVKPMIAEVLGDLDCEVLLYEPTVSPTHSR